VIHRDTGDNFFGGLIHSRRPHVTCRDR
jgi:hypothetical protein